MLAPGHLLQDRYQIRRPIAQGGVGAVYEAIDQRLGHTVAIKQILHSQPQMRAAFEQEARLLASLRHPSLPKVTDHFVDPSGQFLVMDYIPGDDLATLALRQTQLPATADVLRWADQLLDLLTYLHSQQPPVIHRDIKPHNLKLNAGGAIVLLDFGLAKGAPAPNQTGQNTAPEYTAGQSIAGYTLHYASPEQLRGEETGAASDLYSLAATLYDLLAMERPPDALQRLAAIASGQPDPLQPLHTRNPAIPFGISAVIHQALALSPRARFADAAAMRHAFHNAGGEATQIVSPPEEVAAPPHNLPTQLTSFVAREAEVTAVQQRLLGGSARLVTLTGPGGIGKTRLALAIATRCLGSFPDGIFFVSLAPITDTMLVLPTIAQTLGLRETGSVRESLHEHLRDKALLLVLDNFEQVVSAAPQVSDLLAAAAQIKILVTSREALQVRGEQEFPVPALDLPDLRHLPATGALADYAAIRLFVQRAQAVKPDFALDESNAAAIAEICKRLDGLPLALELAAASIKILSVHAIVARLSDRIALPGAALRDLPDRQRTLRASIGWSYDLLTEEEKAIFRRLSIFSGSFALEAAEALCGSTGIYTETVLDTIAALVVKSLVKPLEEAAEEATGEVTADVPSEVPADVTADVTAEMKDEPRFTMLETIREFGLKRLEEEGERERVAAAHAAYYARLAQEAGRGVWTAAVAQWVSRLNTEIENLRATLTYYLAHPQGAEAALQVAGSLWRFWEMRGYILEGRTWLDRALQRRHEAPPASRWLPLHGAGNLATVQDEYAIANAHYEESLQLLQELLPTLQDSDEIIRTRYAIGNSLLNIGNCAILQGDFEKAFAYTGEAITLLREIVDLPSKTPINRRAGLAITLTNMAFIKLAQGDYAQAEAYSEESLANACQLGDGRGIGWNLHRLGIIARDRGDYEKAAKLFDETQRLFEKLPNYADMPRLAYDQGELARLQGDEDRAEAAYQRSLSLAQELGNKKEVAALLNCLGLIARQRRNYASAAALCEEAISLQRAIGDLAGLSDSLLNRGELALAQQNFTAAASDLAESLQIKARLGDRKGGIALLKAFASLAMAERRMAERAARLLAAAESLRQRLGIAIPPCERAADQARRSSVAAAMGQEMFAIAWTIGQTMDWEQATTYALSTYTGAHTGAYTSAYKGK